MCSHMVTITKEEHTYNNMVILYQPNFSWSVNPNCGDIPFTSVSTIIGYIVKLFYGSEINTIYIIHPIPLYKVHNRTTHKGVTTCVPVLTTQSPQSDTLYHITNYLGNVFSLLLPTILLL